MISKEEFDNIVCNLMWDYKNGHKGEDIDKFIMEEMTEDLIRDINPYDLICELNNFNRDELCPTTLKTLKTRIIDAISFKYEECYEVKPMFKRGDFLKNNKGKNFYILSYDKKYDEYYYMDDEMNKGLFSRNALEKNYMKVGVVTEEFLKSF